MSTDRSVDPLLSVQRYSGSYFDIFIFYEHPMVPTHMDQHSLARKRRKYFVDPAVQGALLQRAVCHWMWASFTFAMIIFIFRVAPAWLSGDTQPTGRIWYHLGPYLIACGVLFPIVVFSEIRFSNRFAGPMVRVRRALKQLAEGQTPSRLAFRAHDFWSDIARDINGISDRMGRAGPSTSDALDTDENVHAYESRQESLV